jgi:hypothetical protein
MFDTFPAFSYETLKEMKAYVGDLKIPLKERNICNADSLNWEGVICYCNSSCTTFISLTWFPQLGCLSGLIKSVDLNKFYDGLMAPFDTFLTDPDLNLFSQDFLDSFCDVLNEETKPSDPLVVIEKVTDTDGNEKRKMVKTAIVKYKKALNGKSIITSYLHYNERVNMK